MVELIRLIPNNSVAGTVLLAALALIALAFCALVALFIRAFAVERPIQVKLLGAQIEPRLRVETGRIGLSANKNPELYNRDHLEGAEARVECRFTQRFNEIPKLAMGLVKLDAGAPMDNLPKGHGIVRVEASAEQVTNEGFTLHVKTWKESRLDDAVVSWLAIGR